MSVRFLTHESAERHDGRDAGKEEENDGSQALHVEAVSQHAEVHHRVIAVLYVVDHTSEEPAAFDRNGQVHHATSPCHIKIDTSLKSKSNIASRAVHVLK